jgi:hypothetical protein
MTYTSFGKNIVGSAVLDDRAFADDATVDFTDYFNGLYKKYHFYILDYVPATDFTSLYMRTSQDGSTFDSGASDYNYVNLSMLENNTAGGVSDVANAAFIRMNTNGIGGVSAGFTGAGYSGYVAVYDPLDSSRYTNIFWDTTYRNSFNQTLSIVGGAQRQESDVVKGVQFYSSSGNINGRIVMVGVE